ncbi:M20 family metallopeptidase [Bremerella cremea]|uniref:M20 family metallopeptidase n=1 Tax=Bremerella cremea TaxID=1031537 RepID=UPI0031F15096
MPMDVVQLTQRLVQVPSVNPMGHKVDQPEIQLEYRLGDLLEKIFQEIGVKYERMEVSPQRDNVVACLPGSSDKIIVLEAHQDTVPVDGMTVAPFGANLVENRIYGRGACDVKGGMAMCLAVLSRLKEQPSEDMPTVLVACTVNEECGFTGARHLASVWKSGESQLISKLPDAVIVAEPTLMNVVVSHKGVVRWRCHAKGQAAHSSRPSVGDNAIYRMGDVLRAIREYEQTVLNTAEEQGVLGLPTISVGTVHGGVSVNTVPDRCTIEIDRRVLPGESQEAVRQEVIDFIASRIDAPEKVEHDPPYMSSPGLPLADSNQELARRIADVASEFGVTSESMQVAYGTDSPAYFAIGVPSVVFGPGSLAQAHTKDEFIEIEQLYTATDVLEKLCRGFG